MELKHVTYEHMMLLLPKEAVRHKDIWYKGQSLSLSISVLQ
jgi:hypothetical protein